MTEAGVRAEAARDLTRLMEADPAFCFLRLGDGELAFLLRAQNQLEDREPSLKPSCEIAHDGPGIHPRHAARLLQAYERCSYLDFYERVPFNAEYLGELALQRPPELARNSGPETSQILFTWTLQEFGPFLRGRRSLFAGAEGALLRELWSDAGYRQIAHAFWPADATVFFHQVRDDGRRLSDNLDATKADLAVEIRREKIDTLFLCLGGAAKIICQELSAELGIRTIDFGSMMRALAYCGSSGGGPWRASHTPFCVRVPFELHLRALERAQPSLTTVELLARAHAQLCLELQRMEPGVSFASDAIDPSSYDPSEENLARFREGVRVYLERYRPRARGDAEAESLVSEFAFWCEKKGLGGRGRLFQAMLQVWRRARVVLSMTPP
jgi:hypothetical protein